MRRAVYVKSAGYEGVNEQGGGIVFNYAAALLLPTP